MERNPKAAIANFIKDIDGPLLLALSGGHDSWALFKLLRATSRPLHLLHVDHGWRPSSSAEAATLQAAVDLPFHLRKIDSPPGPNAEDRARQGRLAVYREVCEEVGASGVFLAHHRDDWAETVFKRVVEGAPLTQLGALQPIRKVEGVTLYRPLLQFRKSELDGSGAPIDDPSNQDTHFFRNRLRKSIFPAIGKEVAKPLTALAEEAHELTAYLDRKIAAYPFRSQDGRLTCDLSNPPDRFELRHLLRRFAQTAGIALSRTALETACSLVEQRAPHKQVPPSLHIDRGTISIIQ